MPSIAHLLNVRDGCVDIGLGLIHQLVDFILPCLRFAAAGEESKSQHRREATGTRLSARASRRETIGARTLARNHRREDITAVR